ncbi:uncharacterized protein LACBIDRAFT_327818 [Laccaria bicolor S238N-H82]|uniref:Predicted protein n=1 Tax=Laccaria bicolor (strain S238N-H82 / ATCC MYA-4686) TaxID=486041 RepID=B0DCX6_LACBS|nr:uncharacterized protein LACBIDRAFT_327818 [Laccaria bicolor S238N-H82]EDR07376.1 predicted protein [Laccaria bicolor S238N-H82]|eukprot:XP_001881768.1 predicted protein [Laccaria bicolor S238N-H82]
MSAVYSARYISDRFLPDKAIDLVDDAHESKPDELESLEWEVMTLQIELESLKNESDTFSMERRNKVEQELKEKREEVAVLTGVWHTGRICGLTRDLKHQLDFAQRHGQFELASRLWCSTIPELQRQLPAEGDQANRDQESPLAMLHDRATSNNISRVEAKATGIPV